MPAFPNLAGLKCDGTVEREIEAVGGLVVVDPLPQRNREPVTSYGGQIGLWSLSRRWYYWSAESSLPFKEEVARELNEAWGTQVRADGFAGGTDIKQDRLPTCYHIDTSEGLAAFAKCAIRQGQDIGSKGATQEAIRKITRIEYALEQKLQETRALHNQLRWMAGERR